MSGLTNDPQRAYFYDDEQRLRAILYKGVGWSMFNYDAFGRLRARGEWVGLTDATIVVVDSATYLYDGGVVLQERDGSPAVAVNYTRGLDLSGSMAGAGGIGGLLARSVGANHAYYHSDGGGNITMLTDSKGNMVARYHYDPYGNLLYQMGPLAAANVYRFSSKEIHKRTGMYYYVGRFYDPAHQRWLNRDPLGEAGGVNLYGFVGNAPVDELDPFGLTNLPGDFGWGNFSQPLGTVGWNSLPGLDAGGVLPSGGPGRTVLAPDWQAPPPVNTAQWRPAPDNIWQQQAMLPGAQHLVGTDVGRAMSEFNELAISPFLPLPCFIPRVARTTPKINNLADDILNWVGPKSTLEKPPGGSDLILRSADNTKQIRFDLTNPHGLQPHVNVETFTPRSLFPGDRKMIQTGNQHVYPQP